MRCGGMLQPVPCSYAEYAVLYNKFLGRFMLQ